MPIEIRELIIKSTNAHGKDAPCATGSKMQISFDDHTNTITIETAFGTSIRLDEAGSAIKIIDQNYNTITMDSSGIKVESPLSIEVKAGTSLAISAASSLSISAVSISIKADADVSVQGAIATLSSEGTTEITGSVVKIN
jgi:hypothetical protein